MVQERRAQYQIEFSRDTEGKVILIRNGKLFTTTSKSLEDTVIFVIAADGKLYAERDEIGEFHHSSFLGGGAVAGAGSFKTDRSGHLIEVSNASGHYQPDDRLAHSTLLHLQASGVDLNSFLP